MKLLLGAASLALLGAASALSFAGASAHAVGGGQYYEYTYFSDATLTVEVGWAVERCIDGRIILGQANGTATAFYTTELIGRCNAVGSGGDY